MFHRLNIELFWIYVEWGKLMNIKRKINLLKSSIFVLIVMVMFFSNIHSIFVKSTYKVGSNLEEYLTKNLWYKNHFINLYGEILKMGGFLLLMTKTMAIL